MPPSARACRSLSNVMSSSSLARLSCHNGATLTCSMWQALAMSCTLAGPGPGRVTSRPRRTPPLSRRRSAERGPLSSHSLPGALPGESRLLVRLGVVWPTSRLLKLYLSSSSSLYVMRSRAVSALPALYEGLAAVLVLGRLGPAVAVPEPQLPARSLGFLLLPVKSRSPWGLNAGRAGPRGSAGAEVRHQDREARCRGSKDD